MNKYEIKGAGCLLLLIFFIGAFFVSCRYAYILGGRNELRKAENSLKHEVVIIQTTANVEQSKEDSWNDFIEALVWVESKGNCCAVGDKDDTGVLQIRKPIVDDCNRILGCEMFTYEDRLDSLKSVQMFNVIQDHYNPSHDKHFALKIWNSRAPISYHRKVMRKLGEIENERKNKNYLDSKK